MTTRTVLIAYSRGMLSRGAAMQALGLEWYGDLLTFLSQHQVARPQVSTEDALLMDKVLNKVLG